MVVFCESERGIGRFKVFFQPSSGLHIPVCFCRSVCCPEIQLSARGLSSSRFSGKQKLLCADSDGFAAPVSRRDARPNFLPLFNQYSDLKIRAQRVPG